MYKEQEIIENVGTYLIADGNLLVRHNSEGCYSLALNGVGLGVTDVTDYFLTPYNVLFNKEGDSATYIYDLEQKMLSPLCQEWRVVFHRKNSHVIYKDANKRYYYKTELLEGSRSSKYLLNTLVGEGGVSRTKSEVFRVDWGGNILWSFPFEALGEDNIYSPGEVDHITNILGIVGDLLWFATKFGRLVALDVATGKVIYQLSGNPADQDKVEYTQVAGLGDCFFRESDSSIVCISYLGFQVIDTTTGNLTESYVFREEDPDGIGRFDYIYAPLLQGDYFTFLAEMKTDWYGPSRVGIFDYKARKLVWTEEIIPFEERKVTRNCLVRSQPLYISGDKLYIRDLEHTLHIFQRE